MKQAQFDGNDFFWLLQTLCTLHRKPFSLELARQNFAAPFTPENTDVAAAAYGFESRVVRQKAGNIGDAALPVIVWLTVGVEKAPSSTLESGAADAPVLPFAIAPAVILQAEGDQLLVLTRADSAPTSITRSEFALRYTGYLSEIAPRPEPTTDPDVEHRDMAGRKFGFSWFFPELMKHKRLWKEILLASLVIQLIALITPLFTQAIIDKVIVHRTESTLYVLIIGMAVFMAFSGALSWLRQYLVLHTGNRVDAVLSASVFAHLLKLPPAYFHQRPTGVIAARMHGVETIREFISSAAVALVLDCPFLLIFVAIMFFYSVKLTLIVLAVMAIISLLSFLIAPVFQRKLQEQFQLGARNQAFLTEHIMGMETVKSLQFEPQLAGKYNAFLADYLKSSFETKQVANTYNAVSNLLEQAMGLIVLGVGAHTVMHSPDFSIGMLVAFQMFSGRLSQPMLRMVGLWQQFQQASLSMARLGDLMNAPTEPQSLVPSRDAKQKGDIRFRELAFRYGEHAPLLYEGLSLDIRAGQSIAVMGKSGCGKSTLAKLLQGFYQPTAGLITLDGVDIRHMSVNELRSHFGVVPQETILFSGTIQDNLQMANPYATFEQIIAACKMAEIHSAIAELPGGYQTVIGERGSGLSGGQKQRIAIARALLKRPSILVFDEATSALDGPTAEQFSKTINSLKGRVTMLFITHSLPKGLQVDAVYRLSPSGAQLLAPATDDSIKSAMTGKGANAGGLRAVAKSEAGE